MDASIFMHNNDDYYVKQITNCLCYSYSKIKEKYNRKAIHKEFQSLKGKEAKLELEDYLRNDLIIKYVNKYKKEYNLSNIEFLLGIEEINKDNLISTGILDIKVLLPIGNTLQTDNYIIIECKRINNTKSKIDYYINEGINRFIDRKYYINKSNYDGTSIILAFMEHNINNYSKHSIESIINSLNKRLQNRFSLINKEFNNRITGSNIYNSNFERIDKTNIRIVHIFLNYYDHIN